MCLGLVRCLQVIVLACGECGIASIGQVSTSLNSCDYVCMVTIICVIMRMCSFGNVWRVPMVVAIPLGNYDEMCSFGNVWRVPMGVIPLGKIGEAWYQCRILFLDGIEP